jgi:transposase
VSKKPWRRSAHVDHHKIALDPNNVQATYLARAAGTARFAYNWALAEWGRQYEEWKIDNSLPKPSQAVLRRQLNAMKREQFPWMLEVTKNAPQMAIIQLGQAFQNFFSGRTRYPQFRKIKVYTTASRSPMTSSTSTLRASESPILAGCVCARRCV